MIAQERVILDWAQWLEHFGFCLSLLFIPVLPLLYHVRAYFDPTHVINSDTFLTRMSILLIVVSIISYLVQRRKLKFLKIQLDMREGDFEEALRRTEQSEKWIFSTKRKQIIQAIHPGGWLAAGEMLTIIKLKDGILINSISDPNRRSNSLSKHNKRNVSIFLENLMEVIEQVPEKIQVPVIPEKEWTLSMILKRLLLYPISLSLIILGIYVIFHSPNYVGLPMGIVTIIMPSIYLYSDIQIITKQKSSTSEWL